MPFASAIDIISILQGREQTCILLQRETLSLFIKAGHYVNILQKIVQNKRQSVSLLKMCRNLKDPWRIIPQQ